jgi:hypothetical protein
MIGGTRDSDVVPISRIEKLFVTSPVANAGACASLIEPRDAYEIVHVKCCYHKTCNWSVDDFIPCSCLVADE